MDQKNSPRISAIAAVSSNQVIGINNKLPWKLPADLKHFKRITSGHPIVMGRKTHQSIGRPLPERTNIILSRDKNLSIDGCQVVPNIDQALALATKEQASELFIIGGAEIYQQLLPNIQRLYLTVIHQAFSGDSFFPELDDKEWQEVSCEKHIADESNPYDYSFIVLDRK